MDNFDSEVQEFIAQRPEVRELIQSRSREGLIAYLKANPEDAEIFLRIFAQL